MVVMSNSIQKCIMDIPDEILEDKLFTLLSFDDYMNLMNIGNARLYRCCYVVIKKLPIFPSSSNYGKYLVSTSNYHFHKCIDIYYISKYNMNVITLFFNCFRKNGGKMV